MNLEVIGQKKNGGGGGIAKYMFIELNIALYCFKMNLIFPEIHQLHPNLKT